MKKYLILFVLLGVFLKLSAHPWKPDHYVIIETDCGLDDYWAINLMLTSSKIRVLAIITSNGVVNAEDGYYKVKSLLKEYKHDGILVGLNESSDQKDKNCQAAKDYAWGLKGGQYQMDFIAYEKVLNQVFDNCSEKITFINLSGLNTLNSYFEKYPNNFDKVKEILWTCNYGKLRKSFNYLLDTVSYYSLINENYDINYINGDSFGDYSFDLEEEIGNNNLPLAKNIYKSISKSIVPFAKSMYDESVVFYLLNKEIFDYEGQSCGNIYNLKSGTEINHYYTNLLELDIRNGNQVFSHFSTDSSDYISDIQLMMETTIRKYGKEEWAACVLTSELHRHLGVYSLIGTKMGIRAREYFGAGIDELRIVSYGGLTPPFSCLNDGLQVSTGATLGHGLISVKDNYKLPRAEFYYLGQKITISLKEEYSYKIASEIKELNIIHGLDSEVYWDLVRYLAIKYWSNWSRFDIFILLYTPIISPDLICKALFGIPIFARSFWS